MVCGLQYEIKETKEDSTFTNTMVKNPKDSASKRAKILNKLLQFPKRYIKWITKHLEAKNEVHTKISTKVAAHWNWTKPKDTSKAGTWTS